MINEVDNEDFKLGSDREHENSSGAGDHENTKGTAQSKSKMEKAKKVKKRKKEKRNKKSRSLESHRNSAEDSNEDDVCVPEPTILSCFYWFSVCFDFQEKIAARGKLTEESVQHHVIKCKNAFKHIFKITEYRTDRLRRVAKPGWSSALSGIIWMELKLPCCLSWKVCNIRANDVRCVGSCRATECNMAIECIATKKELSITLKNYDPNYIHKQSLKRKMLPAEKSRYEALLKGRSVLEVRSELADKLMEPHDKEPPILSTASAYRTFKCKIDAPKQDVVRSLLELKKSDPNSIGAIGLET